MSALEHAVVPLLLLGSVSFLVYVLFKVHVWMAVAETIDPTVHASRRIVAENEIMRTLAQVFGGALVLAGIYFTAKNVFVSRRAQTDERFADAVEKLGDESLPRRLGAIHTLESVAQESGRYHWRVMELFTYYIRHVSCPANPAESGYDSERLPPDVQQMLSAIGRRRRTFGIGESRPLDFTGANLRGADLHGANLEGADFSDAKLANVIFQKARLRKASFISASLDNANLNLADMRGANFYRATVRGVQCRQAVLDGASFTWCDMTGSSFESSCFLDVDFANAILDGADFSGARLLRCAWHKANLKSAKFDNAVMDFLLEKSEELST